MNDTLLEQVAKAMVTVYNEEDGDLYVDEDWDLFIPNARLAAITTLQYLLDNYSYLHTGWDYDGEGDTYDVSRNIVEAAEIHTLIEGLKK